MSARRLEWNQEFSVGCAPLCDEELKVVLKCTETTQSMRCRDHTNIAHITAGIGSWTYVYWEFLARLSEYYTLLKPVILF
jgi:hypothetical protein